MLVSRPNSRVNLAYTLPKNAKSLLTSKGDIPSIAISLFFADLSGPGYCLVSVRGRKRRGSAHGGVAFYGRYLRLNTGACHSL